MGIRFSCHVCSKKLNIKEELAGRRGICPSCNSRFRIPLEDTEYSAPVETPKRSMAAVGAGEEPSLGSIPSNGSAVKESLKTQQASSPASRVDALDNEPTSTWYVRPPSGGQYGPADGDTLRGWITEGRVASNSLLWREGWPQWREAKDALPELADQLPSAGGDSSADIPVITPKKPTTSTLVSDSDVKNFGIQDLVDSEPSKPAGQRVALTGTERNVGAERRAKSNKRMTTIAVLIATALVLLFGIAYLLQS